MSLARVLAFIGFLFLLPIFTEAYFLEQSAKSIELEEIYLLIQYLIYLPVVFIVFGFLFREHLPKTSGVLLFTAGIITLIPILGFTAIYEDHLIIGILSSILSIKSGVLLMFDIDLYLM